MRKTATTARVAAFAMLSAVLLSACGGGSGDDQPSSSSSPTPTGYVYVKPPGSTPIQSPWWPEQLKVSGKVWKKTSSVDPTGVDVGLTSPRVTYTLDNRAVTIRYQENLPQGAEGFLAAHEKTIAANKALKGSERTPAGPLTCVLPVGDASGSVTVLCAGKAAQDFSGVFVVETNPSPMAQPDVRSVFETLQSVTKFKAAEEGGLKNEMGVTSDGIPFTRKINTDYTIRVRGGFILNYKVEAKVAPIRVKSNTTVPDDPRENIVVNYAWQAAVRNLTPGFPSRLPDANPDLYYVYPIANPVCKLTQPGEGEDPAKRVTGLVGDGKFCTIPLMKIEGLGSGTISEGQSFAANNQGNDTSPAPEKETNIITGDVIKGQIGKVLKDIEKPTYVLTMLDEAMGQPFYVTNGSCKVTREDNSFTVGTTQVPSHIISQDKKLCDIMSGEYLPAKNANEASLVEEDSK